MTKTNENIEIPVVVPIQKVIQICGTKFYCTIYKVVLKIISEELIL